MPRACQCEPMNLTSGHQCPVISTDEAAEFFANITEETARALCNVIPPRMLSDLFYHGNSSIAPDWFAKVAHEVSHGTIEADHIDKLWAAVDDRIVTLTIERNHAQRKLEELREILRSNDE